MNLSRKKLSVVVPMLNERPNIPALYAALTAVLDGLDCDTELLFVDDGSVDGTFGEIAKLAERDARISCLSFARNFGSHAAILAGLEHATGDAAIIMTADLQEPPELIAELFSKWTEGYDVVWAVRERVDEPATKLFLGRTFYKLFRSIALPDYPETGMDVGLLDRKVLEQLRNLREYTMFVYGMIVWLGFRQTQIRYRKRPRTAGSSGWSLSRRVRLSIDAIVSFSYAPLRMMSYVGVLSSLGSFVLAVFFIWRKLTVVGPLPGWASLMVVMLFMGGMQLTMLGVLGEYLWRIGEQVRGRPRFVIRETLGPVVVQPSAAPSRRSIRP